MNSHGDYFDPFKKHMSFNIVHKISKVRFQDFVGRIYYYYYYFSNKYVFSKSGLTNKIRNWTFGIFT